MTLSRIVGTGSLMPPMGQIHAAWTPNARAEIDHFIVNSRVPGAVLSLFKNADDPSGSRWSYAVLTPERAHALEAAMQARGHALLHELGGVTVAISNAAQVRALDGLLLDLGGPGYLLARPVR
jgi:hypothetical protein